MFHMSFKTPLAGHTGIREPFGKRRRIRSGAQGIRPVDCKRKRKAFQYDDEHIEAVKIGQPGN